jgi:hypothetical protein
VENDERIQGYVYLISGERAKIKVGMSADPAGRLFNLQTGNHTRLEILATFGHAYPGAVETEAHRILRDHWIVGEWFEVEKYAAMTAVMEAMRVVDAAPPRVEVPIVSPETPDDDAETPINIDLSGAYVVPTAPVEASGYLIGYVRPLSEVPAGKQVQWMRSAGVPQENIYIEVMPISRPQLDLVMRDCRSGDSLLAWSAEIFGDQATAIATEARQKGAKVIYADQ